MGGVGVPQQSQFHGGQIFVKLDRPYYYPGNQVQGKVYVSCQIPVPARNLEILIKGKEKCEWEEENGDNEAEYWNKKKILNFKQTVFEFQDGVLQPGNYVIAFDFTLPLNIPSSILFEKENHPNEPEAKVVYKVITNLHTTTGQKITFKSMIVVHEPPVEFKESTVKSDTKDITVWCCQNKGPTTLNVHFPKNVFFGNEVAAAQVQIDNKGCDCKIIEIEFQVVQKLQLKTGDNWYNKKRDWTFDVLENKDFTVIGAKNPQMFQRDMHLDLNVIRYYVNPTKLKKRGFWAKQRVPRMPEEIFMMERIAPACHSELIKNEYFLNVNVKYEDCTCCAPLPSVSVPLTIIPVTDPSTHGLQEPPGFEPIQLGYFRFDIQRVV